MMYELNYYPDKCGDGIYKLCHTEAEAVKEFNRLEKKYPGRRGDAFIRIWRDYDTCDAEVVRDIDL